VNRDFEQQCCEPMNAQGIFARGPEEPNLNSHQQPTTIREHQSDMTRDIRWLQRLNNYQKALAQLNEAVNLARLVNCQTLKNRA
jgi:hypothetical protein